MEKVQIYNTQEEMWKQLGQSTDDANLITRETFDDLYEKALLEYKEKSGFNERFNKCQDKTLEGEILFSADEVALPDYEQEKFNEQYRDLGKSLEFKLLVGLFYTGDKYIFGGGDNSSAPSIEDEEHDNLSSLTQGLKTALSKLNFWGAALNPIFYTTREKLSVPENISDDPEGYLRVLKEEADKVRGLTEEECAEFERLYKSNTP
ncbi:MAG: hypothetical protein Q8R47_00020 [Nanoarchaeota archaeon]|nr:hypothetical protein [Nanoarchaeota archaeon]